MSPSAEITFYGQRRLVIHGILRKSDNIFNNESENLAESNDNIHFAASWIFSRIILQGFIHTYVCCQVSFHWFVYALVMKQWHFYIMLCSMHSPQCLFPRHSLTKQKVTAISTRMTVTTIQSTINHQRDDDRWPWIADAESQAHVQLTKKASISIRKNVSQG